MEEELKNDITAIYMKLGDIDGKLSKLIVPQEKQTTIVQEQPKEKTMYPAVCSVCNIHCTVPFKPNGAVKCIECYKKAKAVAGQ